MKRYLFTGFTAFVALSSTAAAQSVSPQCPAGGPGTDARYTQDVCQKAVDLFQYMAPQLGLAVAGGNATLGQGGTLGLGHFAITLRANAFNGSLPQIDQQTPSVDGAVQSTFTVKKQILGLPQLDAAVGIFGGLPLGFTKVGGVDLLVNAAYIPEVDGDEVQITTPDGSLKLGFGARIGILQESPLIPGVSFTYFRRDLPKVSLFASTDDNDTLRVQDFAVKTSAWRIVASKKVLLFGLAAGVGQDSYDSDASINATVAARGVPFNTSPITSQTIALGQKLKRTNYFLDASINLAILKIVGEIGRVSGGSVSTYNQFDGTQADDARTYGSIGLRFGF